MNRFQTVISRVIGDQDGYYVDPSNPGNERRWGIVKRDHPTIDICLLDRKQALDLHERGVWAKIGGDQLPQGLDWVVLSATMDYGDENTIRWLQRSLDLPDTGMIGPAMFNVINDHPISATIMGFLRRQFEFEGRQWDFQAQAPGMFERFNRMTQYLREDLV